MSVSKAEVEATEFKLENKHATAAQTKGFPHWFTEIDLTDKQALNKLVKKGPTIREVLLSNLSFCKTLGSSQIQALLEGCNTNSLIRILKKNPLLSSQANEQVAIQLLCQQGVGNTLDTEVITELLQKCGSSAINEIVSKNRSIIAQFSQSTLTTMLSDQRLCKNFNYQTIAKLSAFCQNLAPVLVANPRLCKKLNKPAAWWLQVFQPGTDLFILEKALTNPIILKKLGATGIIDLLLAQWRDLKAEVARIPLLKTNPQTTCEKIHNISTFLENLYKNKNFQVHIQKPVNAKKFIIDRQDVSSSAILGASPTATFTKLHANYQAILHDLHCQQALLASPELRLEEKTSAAASMLTAAAAVVMAKPAAETEASAITVLTGPVAKTASVAPESEPVISAQSQVDSREEKTLRLKSESKTTMAGAGLVSSAATAPKSALFQPAPAEIVKSAATAAFSAEVLGS